MGRWKPGGYPCPALKGALDNAFSRAGIGRVCMLRRGEHMGDKPQVAQGKQGTQMHRALLPPAPPSAPPPPPPAASCNGEWQQQPFSPAWAWGGGGGQGRGPNQMPPAGHSSCQPAAAATPPASQEELRGRAGVGMGREGLGPSRQGQPPPPPSLHIIHTYSSTPTPDYGQVPKTLKNDGIAWYCQGDRLG